MLKKCMLAVAPSTFSSEKCRKLSDSEHLWTWSAKRVGLVAFSKTMAGVKHLKRIRKDVFCVAGSVQETFFVDMLRCQRSDCVRGVAFCSIRSSGF